MTASERSLFGLAFQSGAGTPNITDEDFTYMLFRRGSISPANITIPLGPEVGGGSMERAVVKVGVNLTGRFELIPRPNMLGIFMMGVTGFCDSDADGDGFKHVFTFSEDQFAAPYLTARSSPGGMWGEQFDDCRVNLMSLEWRAANFVTGTFGVLGTKPTPAVDMTDWDALSYVDGGPQFLAPVSKIELPTEAPAKCLAGSFVATSNIPLDQQYVVGSYYPNSLDIVNRGFVINMILKIDDGDLYEMMMYDPAQGGEWTAAIMREADFLVEFNSDQVYDTDKPFKFVIAGNGASGQDANIVWTAAPLDITAQTQVVMNVTGTYLASPDPELSPISLELYNDREDYELPEVIP